MYSSPKVLPCVFKMVCVQEDLCLECVLFSLLSLVSMFHTGILHVLELGTIMHFNRHGLSFQKLHIGDAYLE